MENELFSLLDDEAQDRNTHRACIRAVARAQKQFGSFFKQAASEEDFMARLDLVNERINDVVREACIEEGSTSLETVARVLAGELARTSEVMRDDVKEEDIAPSDGEDVQMHVRGLAGRKLLGLDDQEGETKTAAPRRKPVPQMDEGTGRMYQPKKNPPRPKKDVPDHNTPTTEDPMRSKNVVVEDGQVGKPKNQKQLDWEKKNKNKLQKEPAWQDDGATNKSLRELDGERKLVPKKAQGDPWQAVKSMQADITQLEQQLRDAGITPWTEERDLAEEGQFSQGDPMYGEDTNDMFPNGGYQSKVKSGNVDHPRDCDCKECNPTDEELAKGLRDLRQTPHDVEPPKREFAGAAKGAAGATPETGDTYTQERVDLPKADNSGLSDEPSPKMDKGTAGDENHTSQKPIDIPSAWHSPEQQDVTDTADYTATLEVPGVIDTVKADTPMQPELNAAPNTQAFPNKDQANPVTSKWKVLG